MQRKCKGADPQQEKTALAVCFGVLAGLRASECTFIEFAKIFDFSPIKLLFCQYMEILGDKNEIFGNRQFVDKHHRQYGFFRGGKKTSGKIKKSGTIFRAGTKVI